MLDELLRISHDIEIHVNYNLNIQCEHPPLHPLFKNI